MDLLCPIDERGFGGRVRKDPKDFSRGQSCDRNETNRSYDLKSVTVTKSHQGPLHSFLHQPKKEITPHQSFYFYRDLTGTD